MKGLKPYKNGKKTELTLAETSDFDLNGIVLGF